MPDEIINRVHYIAERQTCPEGLLFTIMDGTPIGNMDDDKLLVYEESVNDDVDDGGDDPVE